MKRRQRYTLRARALSQALTRRRIVDAAVDLHRRFGPARTTFSAVAERAGVQRHTLYRHFPTESDLLAACRAQFISTHPLPDVDQWQQHPAGRARLRAGLAELYEYYAANREMIANVQRDSELLPVGHGFRILMQRAAASLLKGWAAAPCSSVAAAVDLAVDFYTWHTLAYGPKLAPADAAALISDMVATTAARRPRR